MYIVKWYHPATGATGQGKPVTYEIAAAWVELLNSQYSDIQHWVETV